MQQPERCGDLRSHVTIAEVFAGCRTPQEEAKAEQALSVFRRVDTPESVWRSVGKLVMITRRAGQPLPFPDLIITAVAMERGIALWSRDNHFTRLQSLVPTLRLFQG